MAMTTATLAETRTPRLPAPDVMRRAFAAKDASFDGTFFAAVRTTGVFCRPVCRAKPARPENLEFFAMAAEALRHGYRPCKMCRPLEVTGATPPLVGRLVQLVDRAGGARVTEDDVRSLGVDPSTARRQFRAHFGMSFAAYQRARRVTSGVKQLRDGRSTAFAGAGAGFQSDSGFRAAVERTFGVRTDDVADVEILAARWVSTPLGTMLAAAHDRGIVLLDFADRATLEPTVARLRAHFASRGTPAVILPGEHRHLATLANELTEYFAGVRTAFTVPIVPAGTAFERRAWSYLRTIPFAETRTYGQQAAALGAPRAARAVGRANGRNTINILIPCHRVVASTGALTGYGGGLARKQWLLRHEAEAKR